MTPAALAIKDYIDTAVGVPLLGRVAIFSVPDNVVVRYTDLLDKLKAEQLLSFAPKAPAAADVFRRVTRAAQKMKVEVVDNPGTFVNVLIRSVSEGDSKSPIIRRIVNETVDPKGKRLDYTETHDVIFNRSSTSVQVRPLYSKAFGDPTFPAADDVAKRIIPEFNRLVGTVSGPSVREILKRGLDDAHSIPLRESGGVLFVPETRAHMVESLERFSDAIPGAFFHSLPLIKNARQDHMVEQAIETDAVGQIDALIDEVSELVKSADPVAQDRAATLLNQITRAGDKVSAYAEILETDLAGVHERLDVARRGVKALFEKVAA